MFINEIGGETTPSTSEYGSSLKVSFFFPFLQVALHLRNLRCVFFFLLIKYWVLIPFLLENLCCLVKFAVMSPLKVSKPMMLHFKGWFGINLRFIYFIWRFQGEAGTYSRCWAPGFRVCLGGGEPSKYQGKSLHLESNVWGIRNINNSVWEVTPFLMNY